LALEESSKAIAIHERRAVAASMAEPVPDLDADFWRDWSAHRAKLRRVRDFLVREDYWFGQEPPTNELLLSPLEDYLQKLDEWAAADNEAKLSGFYVDVDWSTGDPEASCVSPNEVTALIELVHQVGWQVRQGDHIVWRCYQSTLDSMGEKSPFAATAVTGVEQHARLNDLGWEAYRRELERFQRQLDAEL
jgi:AbiV family abortive infection protein